MFGIEHGYEYAALIFLLTLTTKDIYMNSHSFIDDIHTQSLISFASIVWSFTVPIYQISTQRTGIIVTFRYFVVIFFCIISIKLFKSCLP